MNQELIDKACKIIEQNTGSESYCTLALIDANGFPTASTITAAKADGIRWITFCTGLTSSKANRIRQCDHACVCLNTGGMYNITLVGTIEIITDDATKKEMWYEGLKNHFSGADDPNYCVLLFKTQRYSLFVDWKEAEGSL